MSIYSRAGISPKTPPRPGLGRYVAFFSKIDARVFKVIENFFKKICNNTVTVALYHRLYYISKNFT
jgi:hypothetical protein